MSVVPHPKLKAYIDKDPEYLELSDPTTDDAWIAESTSDEMYECPHCDFKVPHYFARVKWDEKYKVNMRVGENGNEFFILHMTMEHDHEPSDEFQRLGERYIVDDEGGE
tara:strand:- start:1831 stop:2157 length:327 start_codon:yes stop_codon:yes gene_type:complete